MYQASMDQAKWHRRKFSAWALSAGVGLSVLSAQRLAWAADGVEDTVWNDAARARNIEVLIRWPASKPLGVIIYSHGLGGKRTGGEDWGKAWAADGFVVVHLQHPGSDAAALKGGLGAIKKATSAEQALARLKDVEFAIAQINRLSATAASPWNTVPVDKLVVGGHSFGALTTMVLAGMQRNGLNFVASHQVKAFIALSPSLGKDTTLQQARKNLAGCTRPFCVMTGGFDGEILNNGETPESRRTVYEALPPGKKAMLWLKDADHLTFAGNEKQIPSTWLVRRNEVTLKEEKRHHALIARTSSAWIREQLLGNSMGAPVAMEAQDQWLRG